MKLTALKANETAWITIDHPTVEDCGIRIQVLHRNALETQTLLRAIQKKRIDLSSTHNVLCSDHRDKQTSCPACEVERLTRLLKQAQERAIDRSM